MATAGVRAKTATGVGVCALLGHRLELGLELELEPDLHQGVRVRLGSRLGLGLLWLRLSLRLVLRLSPRPGLRRRLDRAEAVDTLKLKLQPFGLKPGRLYRSQRQDRESSRSEPKIARFKNMKARSERNLPAVLQ